MKFQSPTRGTLSLDQVYKEVSEYVNQEPKGQYNLIVGSDSQTHLDTQVTFVTAIIIHRVGKGGRYFYSKHKKPYMSSIRQRIYYETFLSLEVASSLTEIMNEDDLTALDLEIHVDAGENGETRDIIKEVVGMVIGSGYNAKIKPHSFGASKVADRHTK